MARYHISPKSGNPAPCRAKGECPIGGEHYESKQEALHGLEKEYAEKALESIKKSPSKTKVKRTAKVEKQEWPAKAAIVEFQSSIPGATIAFHISDPSWRPDSNPHKDRSIEAWLTTEDGNVAFVKLFTRDESYAPPLGNHLAMCDIETRPDQRGRGLALALRQDIEEAYSMEIYSSGNMTPEGFEAFGPHVRTYPQPEGWSDYYKPSASFNSMGFVASWKHKLPRWPANTPRTKEQRDAAWELYEKLKPYYDGEIKWAVE